MKTWITIFYFAVFVPDISFCAISLNAKNLKTLRDGRKYLQPINPFSLKKLRHSNLNLPKFYDLQKEYPDCISLKNIKNQRNCGACWAFASTGAYADALCISKNISVDPSPQYSMNCDKFCPPEPYQDRCDDGCKGGTLYMSTLWLNENHIVDEKCFPYAADKKQCSSECNASDVQLQKYPQMCGGTLRDNSVKGMRAALYHYGSLLVGFFVYDDFNQYHGGVYKQKTGRQTDYHAVRIVGWGEEDDGSPYWIIQNSWGENWGEKGRFRMAAGINDCIIEEEYYFFFPCDEFEG